ncbi:hypothetical protein M0R19_00715 [Candidatus Pacearchaeota archaeon]|nr:hypothetical protein [Candidatus Pacearchaeota archaeon]
MKTPDGNMEFENIWAKFGLRSSPYTPSPLSLIGDIEIGKAFYGRKSELNTLGKRVNSNSSSITLIYGKSGEGKTSLGNYLRWKLCREKSFKESKFITIVEEMRVQNDWNLSEFIRQTLFKIYNASIIFNWKNEGMELKTLEQIKNNLDLFSQRSCEISNEGLKINETKGNYSSLPIEVLQGWFLQLCQEIKGYNKKIILQYNNLENLSDDELGKFLMSIKEILEIPNTHWLFLGTSESISVVEQYPQLHSRFKNYLRLETLTKEEVLEILKLRCECLSTDGINYIKPYDEETIINLYEKLNGNMRFIFKILDDIAEKLSSSNCKVTINEINYIQQKEREKTFGRLTPNHQKILSYLVNKEESSMTDLSLGTGILPSNLPKEIRELKDKGIIVTSEDPNDKRFTLVKLSQKTFLNFVFSKSEE